MNEQVRRLSHELRLFGIHANFEARAATATAKGQHPVEFLELLLEDERLFRKDRLGKSLSSRARFRHVCDLEDWDMSYDRGITKAQIKNLRLWPSTAPTPTSISLAKRVRAKPSLRSLSAVGSASKD